MATVKLITFPDGRVEIQVDGDLDFERAARISETVIALLAEQGIAIKAERAPESHKSGAPHAHIVGQQGQSHGGR